MPQEWVEVHSQADRMDSRTLPPAAFPSLPIDGKAPPLCPEALSEESEEDTPLTAGLEEEVPPVVEKDRPNVRSQIGGMAFDYQLNGNLPEDPDLEDEVLETHDDMLEKGVFQKRKPKSKGKGRARVEDEVTPANIVELEKRKVELVAELHKVREKYFGPQTPLESLSSAVSLTAPAPNEHEDLKLKREDLRLENSELKRMIFNEKNHGRNIAKAKKELLSYQSEPSQPQSVEANRTSRHRAKRPKVLPLRAPLLPTILQHGFPASPPDDVPGSPGSQSIPGTSPRFDHERLSNNVPSAAESHATQKAAAEEEARRDSLMQTASAYYHAREDANSPNVEERTPAQSQDTVPGPPASEQRDSVDDEAQNPEPALGNQVPAMDVSDYYAKLADVQDETPPWWLSDEAQVPKMS